MTGEPSARGTGRARRATDLVGTDRKQRAGSGDENRGRVEIDGEAKLLERLRDPIRRALAGRSGFYSVRVEGLGRCGEVLVAITGAKGRLPLLFGQEELEAGYVARVVNDTLDRFAF